MPGQLAAERREIRLDAGQLTRQLSRSFPRQHCLFGNLACMALYRPVVSMRAGDGRLFVQFETRFQAGGQRLGDGSAQVAGVPRYDSARGAFFVARPRLLALDMPGVPPASARQAAGLLTDMLADEVSRQPLWVLDESDPQQAMARLALRQVSVLDGRLVLVIGDDDVPLDDPFADEEVPAAGHSPGSGAVQSEKSLSGKAQSGRAQSEKR